MAAVPAGRAAAQGRRPTPPPAPRCLFCLFCLFCLYSALFAGISAVLRGKTAVLGVIPAVLLEDTAVFAGFATVLLEISPLFNVLLLCGGRRMPVLAVCAAVYGGADAILGGSVRGLCADSAREAGADDRYSLCDAMYVMRWVSVCVMCGTDIQALHAMCGTDVAYGAGGSQAVDPALRAFNEGRISLSSYAVATPCPVLTYATPLPGPNVTAPVQQLPIASQQVYLPTRVLRDVRYRPSVQPGGASDLRMAVEQVR
eukprot:2506417-Rhodomonas_salina.1